MIFSIDSTLTSSLITLLTNATWDEMLAQGDVRIIYVTSANLLHTLIIASLATFTRKHHIIYPGGAVCLLLSLGVQLAVAECFFVIRILSPMERPLTAYGSLGMLVSMILTVALHEIMIKQTERQLELEVESQANQLINAHQEDLRAIYSSMLSTQHDLRHRIIAAEQMLMSQQDKASSEVAELLKDTDVLHEYVTGNISVDAILTSKTAVMQKSDIHFSFYSTPLDQLPLSEKQFIIILSNILDNAIEGIMRLPSDACSREIKLIFSRNWDIFSVICENDMNPETISFKDGNFVSSKEVSFMHGFGTQSVRKIVESAGGMIDYSAEDKKFIVNIMLPMEE
jgi:Signal transduction histidine kinase regulating citrate/malate metabolism